VTPKATQWPEAGSVSAISPSHLLTCPTAGKSSESADRGRVTTCVTKSVTTWMWPCAVIADQGKIEANEKMSLREMSFWLSEGREEKMEREKEKEKE
jgi:hypothetical protein